MDTLDSPTDSDAELADEVSGELLRQTTHNFLKKKMI